MNAKTRQRLVRLLSIGVTGGLLIVLVERVEWGEFDELLARVSLLGWCVALLAYLALNLLRALRFRILLGGKDAPWRLLMPITLYHNFLVRALPFKLGELSYIALLRSRLNYSMEAGVSSLFGARLLELLIIVMVFAASILSSAEQLAAQRDELLIVVAITFMISVLALYYGGTLVRRLHKLLQPLLIRRDSHLSRLLQKRLEQLADELSRIRQPRLFFSALFISCFTYTCSFLTNYILLRALGLSVNLPGAIAIVSIGMFASAFPFTVSGFGVVEAAWSFGLIQLAGWSEADATATGFLLHGFQLFAAAIYGLAGYALIQFAAPPVALPEESKRSAS
ncbi:MAG: lysylphosphatidylglycerol synthase transmembrane domain-containing protein [Chloroflexi bacterium]|nr:lysylphosphatidylglycerol synthase transmembrane domain-containing protein [Chloroflexota bacterium]MCY4247807.1 lysylphosphatidylglycerol synthase transmembrane domain-containing protein [Chloroflexota bacterium]